MTKRQSLKIGLVFDDSLDSNDGVAQYVKTLGAWLSSEGHKVCYLVGETKIKYWQGGQVFSLARNKTVAFNGNKLTVPLIPDSRQIKRVIIQEKFDVIHVMAPYSPLMSAKIIKQAGPETAIIGTFHIFPAGWLSKLGSKLLRFWLVPTLKRFEAMISVSPVAAEFAKAVYKLNSLVIPNPINISAFTDTLPTKSDGKTVVFLGRLVDRKGVAELIKAFALLKNHMPTARLIIAGDGPQKAKLEKLAAQLNLYESVKFLGYIDEAEKPRLLASADIACFPSLYGESFGIVLVEAMAAGSKVVLGGNNPGYSSVLAGQPLLLVDPRVTASFSRRLHTLLSDQPKISELHKWQQQAVKQYDISVVGPKILAVYYGQIARLGEKSNNKTHE